MTGQIRTALVRVRFYFINLLPTSLLYISILLRRNSSGHPAGPWNVCGLYWLCEDRVGLHTAFWLAASCFYFVQFLPRRSLCVLSWEVGQHQSIPVPVLQPAWQSRVSRFHSPPMHRCNLNSPLRRLSYTRSFLEIWWCQSKLLCYLSRFLALVWMITSTLAVSICILDDANLLSPLLLCWCLIPSLARVLASVDYICSALHRAPHPPYGGMRAWSRAAWGLRRGLSFSRCTRGCAIWR